MSCFSFSFVWNTSGFLFIWSECTCVSAVCVCACVCACESDRTDLPSCPVPCRCAYTGVNVCSWISFSFFFSSWAPLMCRCRCLLEKKFGSTLEDFSLFCFFFIDLTGLSQCAVLQWKGVAQLCNFGDSSMLLRSLLVSQGKVEAVHSDQGCWKPVFFLACHS